MPCEHFQDALTEAAANGAEPQGELGAHLKNCAACQGAFEREQLLFASIDSGMRVVANEEVPPSLLPRVRAALDEMGAPKAAWSPKWFVLAGASAMLAFLFVTQTLWRTRFEPNPVQLSGNVNPGLPVTQPPPRGRDSQNTLTAARPSAAVPVGRGKAQRAVLGQNFVNRKGEPEVLVPGGQEVLLARYAEEWRGRRPAPMVVVDSDESTLKPLEVAPIQIAELDVKLLAETQSE